MKGLERMPKVKYTEDERLRIGREIYEYKETPRSAAEKYDISPHTAKSYYKMYVETLEYAFVAEA